MKVAYRLPVPPTANSIWRHIVVHGRPRTLLSKEYKDWLEVAALHLRAQGVQAMPSPVSVSVVLEGGDGFRRASDLDNYFKPLIDLVKKLGVIENDSLCHVVELHGAFRRVAGGSSCFITIEHLE
jgi:Holliday junction resolvase RusA-like endonuclease